MDCTIPQEWLLSFKELAQNRVMNGFQSRTYFDNVAKNVITVARRIDFNSKLVSMIRGNDGSTIVRIRAGDLNSIEAMRLGLFDAFPLCSITISTSSIDGALEAEVKVLNKEEENKMARKMVVSKRVISYWLLLAWFFFFAGIVEWIVVMRSRAGSKDEL